MRVECESCREVAVATVAIADGSVLVTCSACDAVARVTPGPDGPPEPAVARCPKCGDPRRGDAACAGCGLAAERMPEFAAARDAAVADAVRTAWERVLEAWDAPERHDTLLQAVAMHGAYAWAAGRYRDAAHTHKGDSIAPRQLERLRRAAEATLLASAGARREPVPQPYRASIAILVLFVVAIAAGLLYSVITQDRSMDTAGRSTPARPAAGVAPPHGTR